MISEKACSAINNKLTRRIFVALLTAPAVWLAIASCSSSFDAASAPSTMCLVVSTSRAETLDVGDPELPRVYLDTTYKTPTGRTIPVAPGGDLQAAINQAQGGDVIVLQAGATYPGNFTLPFKTGTNWVTIRTSAPDSTLPAPGKRMDPSYSAALPKIITPNNAEVFTTAAKAHHYRFLGLEIGCAQGVDFFNLISFDAEATTLDTVPHDLIIDRCYVHGNATNNARRGLVLNSAATAVIDSYFSDFHEVGADAQAIAGWNGPGPFKIVNNYLEGAAENFLMGGSDPTIQNLIQSDIEFRLNYVTKPLKWRQSDPTYLGVRFVIKNLFELKNAQRVLVDHNVFENNWPDGQDGMAILFTPRNQNGKSPWSVVQDVTFTNNIVRHSGGLFNIAGPDDEAGISEPSRRILIRNNLCEDIDGLKWNSADGEKADGEFLQLVGGPEYVTADHNTVFQNGNIVTAAGKQAVGFVFRNNIVPHNLYGVVGAETPPGLQTLIDFFPSYVFTKNVMVKVFEATYPTGNFLVDNFGQVGFTNQDAHNYRLLTSSPYHNAGTDGKDVGCDIDALNSVINPVVSISAASYAGAALAAESLAAAFGTGLATSSAAAITTPLPTALVGTTVRIKDANGVERFAPLFYVSPSQINYMIPAGTSVGAATMTVTSGAGVVSVGTIQISSVAPGLFTFDSSGRGFPTASLLRYKASGFQVFEPVARYDAAQVKWVAVPIDLGPATDQLYLILYGTGFRSLSSLQAATMTIGGVNVPVLAAVAQGSFAGLDQINALLPRSLVGRGDVDLTLTVEGKAANTVRLNFK